MSSAISVLQSVNTLIQQQASLFSNPERQDLRQVISSLPNDLDQQSEILLKWFTVHPALKTALLKITLPGGETDEGFLPGGSE